MNHDRFKEARDLVENVIHNELGYLPGPRPKSRDEWGPVCAGCGAQEFRIDGYCSIECRDLNGFALDILYVLRKDTE